MSPSFFQRIRRLSGRLRNRSSTAATPFSENGVQWKSFAATHDSEQQTTSMGESKECNDEDTNWIPMKVDDDHIYMQEFMSSHHEASKENNVATPRKAPSAQKRGGALRSYQQSNRNVLYSDPEINKPCSDGRTAPTTTDDDAPPTGEPGDHVLPPPQAPTDGQQPNEFIYIHAGRHKGKSGTVVSEKDARTWCVRLTNDKMLVNVRKSSVVASSSNPPVPQTTTAHDWVGKAVQVIAGRNKKKEGVVQHVVNKASVGVVLSSGSIIRVLISSLRESTTAFNEEGKETKSLRDMEADDMHPMEGDVTGSVSEEHQQPSDAIVDNTETSVETVSDNNESPAVVRAGIMGSSSPTVFEARQANLLSGTADHPCATIRALQGQQIRVIAGVHAKKVATILGAGNRKDRVAVRIGNRVVNVQIKSISSEDG